MILAYVKPTNFCNVGCTHCYLPVSVRANKDRLSLDRIERMAELLRDMARARRASGIQVLWHGGEPLTLPVSYFYDAAEILDRVLGGRSAYMEAMQTSLIPLKEEHLPWIQDRLGGGVGSSVDFSQRKIKGSVEAYHQLWMQKVDLAREHGIIVIPGVVPTRAELGREQDIVSWMVARDFTHFNIDRYNNYGQAFPDRPSNGEHARFLIGLFDATMRLFDKTGKAPVINVLDAVLNGVLHGVGGDRWGGSCQSDFVVVEPNGALNTCPDKSTIEAAHAHVEDGWEGFAKSRFRRKWVRHQTMTHKQPYCYTCENNSWCRSGCPITPNGPVEGEDECSGYKTFITHVRRFVDAGGRELVQDYQAQAANPPLDPALMSPYGNGLSSTPADGGVAA